MVIQRVSKLKAEDHAIAEVAMPKRQKTNGNEKKDKKSKKLISKKRKKHGIE